MAEINLATPPTAASLSRPHSTPVRLGDALPGVLAEMRRIQREAGR